MAVARSAPRPTIPADRGVPASMHPMAWRRHDRVQLRDRRSCLGRGGQRRFFEHQWQQRLSWRPVHLPDLNDWLATARGRLGYAFDRVLPDVTGGIAFGDTKWANRHSRSTPPTRAGGSAAASSMRSCLIGLPKSNTLTSTSATSGAVWLAPTWGQPRLISRPTSCAQA